MGAHSTINITRSKAKLVMAEKLLNGSDSDLEEFMDSILYDRLYNCRIVNDGECFALMTMIEDEWVTDTAESELYGCEPLTPIDGEYVPHEWAYID